MTHTRALRDGEGTFSEWRTSIEACLVCSRDDGHRWRLWESNDGAYEDEQHECQNCGTIWWVDGPDA
jgi:hypothetical protein